MIDNISEIQFDTKLQNGIQPINILIVDDDDYCMQLIKEILVEEKVNLFFAQDGQEALNIVKSVPEIQIVLMDLKMPIMDGFESTQLIKKLRPNLPVIAQSAYAFAEDQNKAKLAGCDGFIGKPLNRELLITMINKKLLNNKVKQD